MTKYVALLRGINVGGNNKVDMKKLKQTFESAGFNNVSTYINSGNVIFESKQGPKVIVSTIEKILAENFSFPGKVVIRDFENIAKLYAALPKKFTNDTQQKTDILFLWDDFDNKKVLTQITHDPEVDNLTYLSGAVIWNIERKNYNKSGLQKLIGTPLYKNSTARNVNTVRKIFTLMQ